MIQSWKGNFIIPSSLVQNFLVPKRLAMIQENPSSNIEYKNNIELTR